MTPIAEMVSKMLAAGVSADMVTLAVATAEEHARGNSAGNSMESRLEKIRTKDRERKRLKADSNGIPLEIPRNDETALSYKEEEREKEGSKKARAKRKIGVPIPPEWAPTEKHFLEGLELGLDRAAVVRQGEDLRLWGKANEHRAVARKADWDLTFTGWMRRNSNGPRNHQAGGNSASQRRATGDDAILAGMGRIASRVREKERAAGSGGEISGSFDAAGGPAAEFRDEGSADDRDEWPGAVLSKDAA